MLLTARRWMNRRKVSAVGITRFSLIFRSNHPFRDKTDPFDMRVARLFDEARLRRRFAIWEAITLPSLAAQTDNDFSLLIVTSSLLPRWARERLDEVLDAQPFAARVVAPEPEQIFSKTVRRNVRALVDQSHGVIATFRLDDDDALAANFVERFRAEGAKGRRARPPIDIYGFENGWFLAAADAGDSTGLRLAHVTRPLIACGLGRMSPRAPLRTIHDPKIGHTRLGEILPTRHCGGPPTWIVTAHDLNDSDRRSHEGLLASPILTPTAACDMLGPNFAALDLENIAATLRGD